MHVPSFWKNNFTCFPSTPPPLTGNNLRKLRLKFDNIPTLLRLFMLSSMLILLTLWFTRYRVAHKRWDFLKTTVRHLSSLYYIIQSSRSIFTGKMEKCQIKTCILQRKIVIPAVERNSIINIRVSIGWRHITFMYIKIIFISYSKLQTV